MISELGQFVGKSSSLLWLAMFRRVLTENEALQLDPNIGADYDGTPYPFGMDPVRIYTYQ